jgi:hypothetical protein
MLASEAAVRRMIEELRTGKPDYDRMSPQLGCEEESPIRARPTCPSS